jgi:hypothetical protein
MAHQDDGSAGIAVVCVLIALFLVGKANGDSESPPQDDGLSVTKEVRLTDAAGLPATVAALGGPVDKPPALPGADQAVVARARWTGPDRASGTYQLVVLDNRTTPPRPLPVYVGWDAGGGVGEYWTGGYDKLAARYEWLAGRGSPAAPSRDRSDRPWAVGAPATAEGGVAGVYLLDEGIAPFKDPDRELLVVLFFVDASGEVRWARNV